MNFVKAQEMHFWSNLYICTVYQNLKLILYVQHHYVSHLLFNVIPSRICPILQAWLLTLVFLLYICKVVQQNRRLLMVCQACQLLIWYETVVANNSGGKKHVAYLIAEERRNSCLLHYGFAVLLINVPFDGQTTRHSSGLATFFLTTLLELSVKVSP